MDSGASFWALGHPFNCLAWPDCFFSLSDKLPCETTLSRMLHLSYKGQFLRSLYRPLTIYCLNILRGKIFTDFGSVCKFVKNLNKLSLIAQP